MIISTKASNGWCVAMYSETNWDDEKITIVVELTEPETKKQMVAEFAPDEFSQAKTYYKELVKFISEDAIVEYGKGFHDGYVVGKHNAKVEAKYANYGDDMWI